MRVRLAASSSKLDLERTKRYVVRASRHQWSRHGYPYRCDESQYRHLSNDSKRWSTHRRRFGIFESRQCGGRYQNSSGPHRQLQIQHVSERNPHSQSRRFQKRQLSPGKTSFMSFDCVNELLKFQYRELSTIQKRGQNFAFHNNYTANVPLFDLPIYTKFS